MSLTYSIPKEFSFTQSTPSDIWVIDYPFSGVPVIDIYIDVEGTPTKIIPTSVTQTSTHSAEVRFSTAYSGTAHLVG